MACSAARKTNSCEVRVVLLNVLACFSSYCCSAPLEPLRRARCRLSLTAAMAEEAGKNVVTTAKTNEGEKQPLQMPGARASMFKPPSWSASGKGSAFRPPSPHAFLEASRSDAGDPIPLSLSLLPISTLRPPSLTPSTTTSMQRIMKDPRGRP